MVKKQNGITLIELLITVALIGIVAATIMPLGQAWMANTNINKAEKLLSDALAKARNEALRNPNGAIGATTKAASLTINNTTKNIAVKNSSDTVIWQSTLPASVTITLSPTCSDLQLNNNGQNLSACTDYTITANGGTNATGKI